MSAESTAIAKPRVSVVVCSHNPRPAYLSRTLTGLREQTLPIDQWELVLIDNASREPLSKSYDLSWHPNSRHIQEARLGAVHARYRSLHESTSDLILFVDDDNVLDREYLQVGLEIERAWPILGTWGGQNIGEFEVQPAAHLQPYVQSLAVRPCDRDYWTNVGNWCEAFPFGAGMFIRRQVMVEYHKAVAACPFRLTLGPRGLELFRGEDYDMNLTACDIGLGCGVFKALKLIHIMPAQRVSDDYLLRLEYGNKFSNTIIACIRGNEPPDPTTGWSTKLKLRLAKLVPTKPNQRFRAAALTGIRDALRAWHDHNRSSAP